MMVELIRNAAGKTKIDLGLCNVMVWLFVFMRMLCLAAMDILKKITSESSHTAYLQTPTHRLFLA